MYDFMGGSPKMFVSQAFEWTKKCSQIIEQLKEKLISIPIIQPHNWSLLFQLMCNASDFSIRLSQCNRKTKGHMSCTNTTLDSAHMNYTTIGKEIIVIVFAFNKFGVYLTRSPIVVYMDHCALKYLLVERDAKTRLIHYVLLL